MLYRKHVLLLLAGLALTANVIAYFGMQLLMGLVPCSLCILDRAALFIVIGGVAVYCFIPLGLIARLLGYLGVVGGIGLGLASTVRHVWLERNPESVGCLFPSQQGGWLGFVLDAFAGTSDCSQVSFRLLGFSLAEMTLALFAVLTLLLIISFLCKPTHR